MSQAEERAALDVGVVAVADPTGVKGIFYSATHVTTNVPLELPKIGGSPVDSRRPMQGKWLNFYSSDKSLQYAFGYGTTGPTLVYNQAVNQSAGTGTPTARGATIPAGQIIGKIIPSGATFVSIIGPSDAAGVVELYISEGPG